MRKALCIATFMATAALLAAPAHAVVESGHWQVNSTSNVAGANTGILVDQTVGGDYTGAFINYNAAAGTIQFVTLNIDEGSGLYLVKPGDVMSNESIPGLTSLNSAQRTPIKVGKDFYLGGATSSVSDPGVTWSKLYPRTSFGWAHFTTTPQGTLQIIDSAMAFREPGIIVGTTQAIPEPGTSALMGLGLLGITTLRRARRQHPAPH